MIFVLSAQPKVRLPLDFPLVDKVLHFILYAGFGLCLAFGISRWDRQGLRSRFGLLAILGIILGGLDEVHQLFVPGRSADIADAAVDVLGILAGGLIVRIWIRSPSGRKIFGGGNREIGGGPAQP